MNRRPNAAGPQHAHRFRSLFDNLTQPSALLTADGTVTDFNQAALRSSGFARDQINGRKVWETPCWAGMPEAQRTWQERIARALITSGPVEGDQEYRTAAGDVRSAKITLTAVRAPDGSVDFLLAEIADRAGPAVPDEKTLAESLRAGEALARSILENSADRIALLDADSRVEFMNEPGLRSLELQSLEAIYGSRWIDLWPQPYRQKALAAVEEALQGRKGNFEGEFVTPSGRATWWNVNITPTPAAVGRPQRLLCVSRDITGQRHALQAQLESEAQFRITFQYAGVGIAHVGLDGRFLRINQRLCDITGYPEYELRQMTFADITHPDDIEQDWAQARRLLAGEISNYSMEKRYRRKDGSWIWGNLTVALQPDESGAPQHFISVIEDISDRKFAQEALRRNEEHLRLLSNTVPAVIFYADSAGRYQSVNDTFVKWFDTSRDRLIGRTIREFVGESAWEIIGPRVAQAYAGETVEYEAEVEFRTGGRRWIHPVYTPHLDTNGRVLGIIALITDVTERRRADMDIARLAAIVTSSSDAMIGHTVEGIITTWNQGAERMFGYTAEEMIGNSVSRLFAPGQLDRENEILAKVRDGIEVREFESLRVTRLGKLINVAVTLSPVFGKDGQIAGASKVIRDITKRKRAEAALRESERRLRMTLNASRTVAFEWNVAEGKLRRILPDDPSTVEVLGTAHVISIDDHFRRIHPDDRAKLLSVVTGLSAGDSSYTLEYRIVAPNGESVWMHDFASAEFSPDGTLLFVRGVTANITPQKRAEEQMRLASDRLQFTVDKCDIGIGFVDIRTGETVVNAVTLAQFDVPPGVPLSQALFESRVHPEDRERLTKAYAHSIESGDPLDQEYRIIDASNRIRWIRSTGRVACDADGKLRYYYSANIDITGIKRVEENLRAANDDLNRYAYAVAHDLREPVRNIAVITELLTRFVSGEAPLQPERLQLLNTTVKESVRRVDQLLMDLLQYSQAGEQADRLPETELEKALESALGHLAGPIQESGAVIEAGPLPRLYARESDLVSVLQNLIGNAIKYRREDPPRITLVAQLRSTEWVISVRDNGEGIEAEFTRHIFGMFKRLHGREIPGTGIGLAICERIVNKYGGRIWVESVPGQGSNFQFTWPLYPAHTERE